MTPASNADILGWSIVAFLTVGGLFFALWLDSFIRRQWGNPHEQPEPQKLEYVEVSLRREK